LDKFASIEVEMGEGGVALIDNCVARFECRTHQTYEGGDHIIFIGEVMAFDYDTTRSPLAFTGGSYAQTAPHIHDPDAQSQDSTVDG
jgi:3-hydroxy-9,10-secoandrosta-1,3,5(10)-triene-9,17-dione monooxygenase reductase component